MLHTSPDSKRPGADISVRDLLVSAEKGYQYSDSADLVLLSAKQTVLVRVTGVNAR